MEVGAQGELLAEEDPTLGAADEDPEFDEPDGAHAEVIGVDSARAARQGHKYPKAKYAGGATGAVLGETFGGDAA